MGGNEPDLLARRWALVAAHRDRLLRVVASRTSSAADAEDIVHEAMVRAVLFEDLDEDRVGPFLTTVAMRLCADVHRRNGRTDRMLERLSMHGVDEESPEEAVCDAAEARAVAEVYETLPERQRSVVAARSEGMSCGQVAGRLGMTYGAVESALMRARTAVRARVEICLETTALCASRVAHSLRAVPSEVPTVSVLALGGLLATVLATASAAPLGEPVPAAARLHRLPIVTTPVPTPAPRPQMQRAAHPVVVAPLPAAVSPVVPDPRRTKVLASPPGPAYVDREWSGMSTVEEVLYCLDHLEVPHLCPPDPSPTPKAGETP